MYLYNHISNQNTEKDRVPVLVLLSSFHVPPATELRADHRQVEMLSSVEKDPPLKGTRQRGRSRILVRASNWRVTAAKAGFALITACAIGATLMLLLVSLVPLAFIITLPGLCACIFVLALTLPQLVYIYFADSSESNKPTLVTSLRKCLQVDYAVWRIVTEAVGVGRRVARDLLLRRVQNRHHYRTFLGSAYGTKGMSLDVYAPLTGDETAALAPVVMFFSPQIRPFASRKVIFSSLGANLADVVGAVVVIPDLPNHPEGRIKEQIEAAREAIKWAIDNVHRFGGDPNLLYLAGMGVGATIAQLVPLQAAVVESRRQFLAIDPGKTGEDLPTGVKEVQEYGGNIPIPRIEGLIVISPITNVEEQMVDEESRGMDHLSLTRRTFGPTERACYFHSPAHLLYAARNIIQVDLLPRKVLFIHGGLDKYIKHTQSEEMKEILRGVGVEETRVKLYTSGHWGTVLPLMCDLQGPPLIDEVYDFIWATDAVG